MYRAMLVYQWINKIIKLYNIIGIMSRTLKLTMKCYKKNQRHKMQNQRKRKQVAAFPQITRLGPPHSGKSRQPPADIRSLRRGWFKNLSRDRGGQPPSPFRPLKQAQPDKRDICHGG